MARNAPGSHVAAPGFVFSTPKAPLLNPLAFFFVHPQGAVPKPSAFSNPKAPLQNLVFALPPPRRRYKTPCFLCFLPGLISAYRQTMLQGLHVVRPLSPNKTATHSSSSPSSSFSVAILAQGSRFQCVCGSRFPRVAHGAPFVSGTWRLSSSSSRRSWAGWWGEFGRRTRIPRAFQ